jgi:hypothetical protein
MEQLNTQPHRRRRSPYLHLKMKKRRKEKMRNFILFFEKIEDIPMTAPFIQVQ